MSAVFLTGAALGLSVAAPFGPVSLLCVQRSLSGGYRCGIASGLGAATAQTLYATLAAVGADVAAVVLRDWHAVLHLVSAVILIGLGVRILLRSRRRVDTPGHARTSTFYASALLLALSNPMTVLPYLALASADAAELPPSLADMPWEAGGVLVGSGCWYCSIVGAACIAGQVLAARVTQHLNVLAGGLMIGLGVLISVH
jgi:threonine/homoserine/homoserine lactone efflux protein